MIEFISFSTVIVNSAIAIYTSDRVRQYITGFGFPIEKFFMIVIAIEHILIALKYFIT